MSFLTLSQWTAELAKEVVAVEAKAEAAKKLGATAGLEDARSRAPVATGTLRDSIEADEDGYGSDLRYAGYVEFGTSDTAPQPYIGPSADTAENVLVTALVATVGP